MLRPQAAFANLHMGQACGFESAISFRSSDHDAQAGTRRAVTVHPLWLVVRELLTILNNC